MTREEKATLQLAKTDKLKLEAFRKALALNGIEKMQKEIISEAIELYIEKNMNLLSEELKNVYLKNIS